MRVELQVAREAKAMPRQQVIEKALNGELSWLQAAVVLGISYRHLCHISLSGSSRRHDGNWFDFPTQRRNCLSSYTTGLVGDRFPEIPVSNRTALRAPAGTGACFSVGGGDAWRGFAHGSPGVHRVAARERCQA